jgi:MFS family permease
MRQRALSQIEENQKWDLVSQRRFSQEEYSEVLKKIRIRGKMAEEVSVIMHDPNKKNISLFLMVMSVANMSVAAGAYMNICTALFEVKYGWTTQNEKDFNEGLMNTIPAIGTIFGSGSASYLMVSGRPRAFIFACLIGILGSFLTLI